MECVCNTGVDQLHQQRDCRDALAKVIHVSPMAKKGTSGKNYIDLATIPVPEVTFKGLYSSVNGRDRLHTIYDIKDTDYENRDFRTKEYNDGTSERLGGGGLSLQFVTKKSTVDFIISTLGLDCANPDVFLHLGGNKIIGYADPDMVATEKKLYPLPVDRWEVTKYNPTNTDNDTAHVEITIHFAEEMNMKHWVIVDDSEHEWDESENYEPCQGIAKAGSGTTTSSVFIELYYQSHGIMGNSVPASGLQNTVFGISINGTPDTVVASTETPDGTYELQTQTQLVQNDVVVVTTAIDGYIFPAVTQIIP